ncbi:MAG: alkaline phosphatase family protein [Bacillota bacterium]
MSAHRFALFLLLLFSGAAAAVTPRAEHVVLVIEENRSFQVIMNSSDTPYIHQLAGEGALFTRSYAVDHPSEPNYLALFAGDTERLKDDSCPHNYTGVNLSDELRDAKLSFAIYSENLPAAGFTGCGSDDKLYRRKHNPVPNFATVPGDANQPWSAFPADFSKLPTVAYVVPNMVNDMHDGSAAQADAWLKQNLSGYVLWAKTHHSLLILTWDEDDGTENNRIVTLIAGEDVKPGRFTQHLTHYGVLRTLTDMYGLRPIGQAVNAKAIIDIWK